jgi:hypothetical protein
MSPKRARLFVYAGVREKTGHGESVGIRARARRMGIQGRRGRVGRGYPRNAPCSGRRLVSSEARTSPVSALTARGSFRQTPAWAASEDGQHGSANPCCR